MEIYEHLWKLLKIYRKIGNPKENNENCVLIKHFIKELMRKIGRPFLEICENQEILEFLRKAIEIYENLRKSMKLRWKIGNPRKIKKINPW